MNDITKIAIIAGIYSGLRKRSPIVDQPRLFEHSQRPEPLSQPGERDRELRHMLAAQAGVTVELLVKEEAWLIKRLKGRIALFFAIIGIFVLLGTITPVLDTTPPIPVIVLAVTCLLIFLCWVVYRVKLGPEPAAQFHRERQGIKRQQSVNLSAG